MLAQLCKPWLRQYAKRYVHRGLEADDGLQLAFLGFMRAIRDYDPDKGGFMTYLTWWARSQLELACSQASVVRGSRSGRRPYCTSLDAPLSVEDGSATFLEALAAPEPPEEPEHSEADLEARLEALRPLQRACVERRLRGMTYEAIGRELGLTAPNARMHVSSALQRLWLGVHKA